VTCDTYCRYSNVAFVLADYRVILRVFVHSQIPVLDHNMYVVIKC